VDKSKNKKGSEFDLNGEIARIKAGLDTRLEELRKELEKQDKLRFEEAMTNLERNGVFKKPGRTKQ